jgi:hypothetical protein
VVQVSHLLFLEQLQLTQVAVVVQRTVILELIPEVLAVEVLVVPPQAQLAAQAEQTQAVAVAQHLLQQAKTIVEQAQADLVLLSSDIQAHLLMQKVYLAEQNHQLQVGLFTHSHLVVQLHSKAMT